MAAVLDEVGKSSENLVNEEKDEIVNEEDEAGAAEASKKKKKKKKKKKAGVCFYPSFKRLRVILRYTRHSCDAEFLYLLLLFRKT